MHAPSHAFSPLTYSSAAEVLWPKSQALPSVPSNPISFCDRVMLSFTLFFLLSSGSPFAFPGLCEDFRRLLVDTGPSASHLAGNSQKMTTVLRRWWKAEARFIGRTLLGFTQNSLSPNYTFLLHSNLIGFSPWDLKSAM